MSQIAFGWNFRSKTRHFTVARRESVFLGRSLHTNRSDERSKGSASRKHSDRSLFPKATVVGNVFRADSVSCNRVQQRRSFFPRQSPKRFCVCQWYRESRISNKAFVWIRERGFGADGPYLNTSLYERARNIVNSLQTGRVCIKKFWSEFGNTIRKRFFSLRQLPTLLLSLREDSVNTVLWYYNKLL